MYGKFADDVMGNVDKSVLEMLLLDSEVDMTDVWKQVLYQIGDKLCLVYRLLIVKRKGKKSGKKV